MSQQALLHQAQVINMKVKVAVVIMILLSLFVYFFDKYAAKFGNGVYNHYSELDFGMCVTKINQVYITYDENWRYEAYLAPQIEYETKSGKTFLIKKVVGYCLSDNAVIIRFENDENQLIEFSFDNQNDIHSNSPAVKALSLEDCENYFDLNHSPFIVRNWRYINMLSLIVFFIVFFTGSIKYIRTK